MNANITTSEPTAIAIAEPAETATGGRRVGRAAVVWVPGLAVALGAAAATIHGLYEVALAARVPAGIAWLYPLITDGLALVAYAATTRLHAAAARYAWSVVVLAAGLSGLAQAAFLGAETMVDAPVVLRYGVGAWPAVAAAIVAHLLYLLATHTTDAPTSKPSVQGAPFRPAGVQPAASAVQAVPVQPAWAEPVQPARPTGVQPARPHPVLTTTSDVRRSDDRDRPRRGAGHRQRLRDMPNATAACPPSPNWPQPPASPAALPRQHCTPCASNRRPWT